MSLSLLATTMFERLRVRARTLVPQQPSGPAPERPAQKRERLRREARALGGVLADIETIQGDCPVQTDQQIRDLTRWLQDHQSGRPIM